MTAPVLIGCSHGTDNHEGRAVVRGILDDVRRTRPDLDVREAFVDVQQPEVDDVVRQALQDVGAAVVVPLLLSAGFHTYVDIARAVEPAGATATGTLGPDPRLAALVVDRLTEAGATAEDHVVLAAAGSSDTRAVHAVEQLHAMVASAWGGPVTIGYGSAAHPRVPVAVAEAPAGRRVVVASYLLAPGFFHDRLHQSGADVVTAPLGPDPRLAEIVLDRYASAQVPAAAL